MTRARDNADLVHTLIGGTSGQTFKASDSACTCSFLLTEITLLLLQAFHLNNVALVQILHLQLQVQILQNLVHMLASDGDLTQVVLQEIVLTQIRKFFLMLQRQVIL